MLFTIFLSSIFIFIVLASASLLGNQELCLGVHDAPLKRIIFLLHDQLTILDFNVQILHTNTTQAIMTEHLYPPWCKPSSTSHLPIQAQTFLQNLNATFTHPQCNPDGSWTYQHPNAPNMIQNTHQFNDCIHSTTESLIEILLDIYYKTMPTLLAMMELWMRLIAFFSVFVSISYLIHYEINANNAKLLKSIPWKLCVFGLVCSYIIATDLVYVLEYGYSFGFTFLLGHCVLLTKYVIQEHKNYIQTCTKILLMLLVIMSYHSTKQSNEKEIPTYQAGLYHSKDNSFITSIIKSWNVSKYSLYDTLQKTPYLITGDARTGIPFLINPVPNDDDISFTRVWVQSSQDIEAIALDIAFPTNYNDTTKPLYLVLHGLNGGSDEGYVREFTKARNEEGSTVIVLIARGLMDTPIMGWNVFHGARLHDLQDALVAIRHSMKHQKLIGVGYSMGAIILSNYMSRCEDCVLDAAVSISGGLDMRHQLYFDRSKRLWQPLLADELRNIALGKFCRRYKERLRPEDFVRFLRSTSISVSVSQKLHTF